jgi:hypothetical protein
LCIGDVFVKSVVREVGRNYGKAISNSLLGDRHSTPVRMVGGSSNTTTNTSKRGYKNTLHKICKTWTIKGHIATFNVAQNMYKSFFDLVEEAQQDGLELIEIIDLMEDYIMMRNQLNKVRQALIQLEKPDLESKVDNMDDNMLQFWFELESGLVVPDLGERPKGFFSRKAKEEWDNRKQQSDTMLSVKQNILEWRSLVGA